MVFPVTRMRRYRKNSKIRDIVRETKLNKEDLIYPIFFKEELRGDEKEPIESMPGEYRYSLNAGIEFAKQLEVQNDGEFVGGCIAGGRNYFHINSAGDAEPCVFIHYSNANIHDQSILEILHSPLFMAYHNGQPFNKNHLRPCPMLENPELLQKMVHETGAHSTDLQSPESVEHLCEKCKSYAANWQPTADEIWSHTRIRESRYENYKDWKPSQPIEK